MAAFDTQHMYAYVRAGEGEEKAFSFVLIRFFINQCPPSMPVPISLSLNPRVNPPGCQPLGLWPAAVLKQLVSVV